MSVVEIKIPTLGESVSEGVIARWLKQDGDAVRVDDPLLELETDKAVMEIPAEAAGRLSIAASEGETVSVGQVIGRLDTALHGSESSDGSSEPRPAVDQTPAAASAGAVRPAPPHLSPAVRQLVREHKLDPQDIAGSGKGGRITKADVLAHLQMRPQEAAVPADGASAAPTAGAPEEGVRREPMSQIRRRIAARLVEAQQTAAILTTFNDVDMSAAIGLRKRYQEAFERKHGVRLGFMSLFGRAVIHGLGEVPRLNARIDGNDLVYHRHVHLGIAVSTERGLLVPVVRHADRLALAELERAIGELAEAGRQGKLAPDALSGGTFSITNGGVFGSLLSTPLLNPPQSGILGMHRIEERPVAREGRVEVRPMMYVALSYDHRIVDGREAVTFLGRVKALLEDPERMLLDV